MKNLLESFKDIVDVKVTYGNHENANMSSQTPSGQMMRFGSEASKLYAQEYLIKPEHLKLHKDGYIHIHDMDYYPTKTSTCLQYDLDELFNEGFRTRNGYVREPQNIASYAALAAIVFQTNQNEQHGGQSIPAFDFFMAPGVLKTYRKNFITFVELFLDKEVNKEDADKYVPTILMNDQEKQRLAIFLDVDIDSLEKVLDRSYKATDKETLQAMQGFIYNLNMMHSRGGNQVVFSSINYGTDFSPEGRMVIWNILKATREGLGKGETPIFPIHVFKVKEGINYSDEDIQKWLDCKNNNKEVNYKYDFKNPNFDLLVDAVETTAERLFPNFMFLDTPYNQNEKWDINDPKRWKYEGATMGCRTRVFENVRGEKSTIGRGNISFTSINFPGLAIDAKVECAAEGITDPIQIAERFTNKVAELTEIVAEQLEDRMEFQMTAQKAQFPFMYDNNLWKHDNHDDACVGEALKQGTLGIGFIGSHNAMYHIFGESHATSKDAYNTIIKTLEKMNVISEKHKNEKQLNFSILATPAEGLSGRFTFIDRAKHGHIEGVTDKDYYVNSFHIDVCENLPAAEEIKLEAPFHALTKGGHISYVEVDGAAKKNTTALMKIVKIMFDEGIGYGSINHPVDKCRTCHFSGVIEPDECPVCGSDDISRTRRITGYLTGDLSKWNASKQAEERDRVKHKCE